MKTKTHRTLDKFSNVFFQLGLTLVLFIVYVSIEHYSEKEEVVIEESPKTENVYAWQEHVPIIKRKKKIQEQPKVQQKPKTNDLSELIKIDNTEDTIENIIDEPDETIDVTEQINTIVEADNPDDDEIENDVPFIFIEEAPIFKGCENLSKEATKACFTKKMNRFVTSRFDTELANDLGLRSGKHKIHTQFIIDKTGLVTDIKIRGPHKRLEKEVLKILQKLPQFTPGKQRSKAVKVRYSLPITFQVH